VGDVSVRPTRSVGYRLNPFCFIVALPCRPIGLNIYGFDDVTAGSIGAVFLDWIITAYCFVRTEDARDLRPRQPRQILQSPDMMMTVDGWNALQLRFLCFSLRMKRSVEFQLVFGVGNPAMASITAATAAVS
jgi:hypothetical protein